MYIWAAKKFHVHPVFPNLTKSPYWRGDAILQGPSEGGSLPPSGRWNATSGLPLQPRREGS
jgi:hypothetical protein